MVVVVGGEWEEVSWGGRGSKAQGGTDCHCPTPGGSRPPPSEGTTVTIYPKEIRTFFVHFGTQ